jgi:ketosteroid isomerase-like protein
MLMKRILLAVAMALLFAIPLVQAQDDQAERIRDERDLYNAAIEHHDVAAIVSFLDDEYQITTSLGQLSQGPDAEAAGWRDLIASRPDVLYVRTPDSIEISNDYPLAAETGTWLGTWSTDAGPVRTGGRYSAMWRRVDDEWKVRSELFVALFCDGVGCP